MSVGEKICVRPAVSRRVPPAKRVAPPASRIRNTIKAPPSPITKRLIALPAQPALIAQLKELQRQYCARANAQDLRGIHEANDAFHVALFSACGNPYLVRSLQDYMNLTLPMRAKNLADTEGLALSRRQHEFMIELLQGRDSWALAQLCVDHMQFSKSDYLGRIGADQTAK